MWLFDEVLHLHVQLYKNTTEGELESCPTEVETLIYSSLGRKQKWHIGAHLSFICTQNSYQIIKLS